MRKMIFMVAVLLSMSIAFADQLTLEKGLNSISIPISLATLKQTCEIIPFKFYNNAELLTSSGKGWKSASAMDPGTGYYVNIKDTCTVEFESLLSTDKVSEIASINKVLVKGANFISTPVAGITQEDFKGLCGDAKQESEGVGVFREGGEAKRFATITGGKMTFVTQMEPYRAYWVWMKGKDCTFKPSTYTATQQSSIGQEKEVKSTNAPKNAESQYSAGCVFGKPEDLKYKGFTLEATDITTDSVKVTVKDASGAVAGTKTINKGEMYLGTAADADVFKRVKGVARFDVAGDNGRKIRLLVWPYEKFVLSKSDGTAVAGAKNAAKFIMGEDIFACGSVDNRVDGFNTGISISAPDTFGDLEKVQITGTVNKAYMGQGRGGTVTLQLWRGVVDPYEKRDAALVWIGQKEADASGNWDASFTLSGKYSYRSGVTYTLIAHYISNGVDVRAYKYMTGK